MASQVPKRLVRISLDTNMLFRAVRAETSPSRELLRMGERNEVRIFLSQEGVQEIYEKIEEKQPNALETLATLLSQSKFQILPTPSSFHVEQCEALIADPDDVMIVATAWAAQVDFLVCADFKHIVHNYRLAAKLRLPTGPVDAFWSWYQQYISIQSGTS